MRPGDECDPTAVPPAGRDSRRRDGVFRQWFPAGGTGVRGGTRWRDPSFGRELFLGHFRLDLIHPHPSGSAEDRERGETFLAALREFCEHSVDGARIERDALIPDHVVAELLVVMAQVPGKGISAFVVEGDSPGITVENRNEFAGQARVRVDELFDRLGRNSDDSDARVARHVLDGRFTWLEEGVLDPPSPGPWIADSTHRASTAQDVHRTT
ncbi:hypothetical protein ACQPYE_35230 [Actinosynnema sp. CA-299493]